MGETVQFTFAGGLLCAGVTDVSGTASCALIVAGTASGQYAAVFAGQAGIYLAASVTATFASMQGVTDLSPLTVSGMSVDGQTILVTATLTVAATGRPIAGQTLIATVSNGANQTLITDASGSVSSTYSLGQVGPLDIRLMYAGTACFAGAAAVAHLTVYEKTYLIVNAADGACGDPTLISSGLSGADVMAGQLVAFNLTDGNPVVSAAAVAVTNSFGVASVLATYPGPGLFAITVSFLNLAGFFVDDDGNPLPTVATGWANVTQAQSSLSAISTTATALVGSLVTLDVSLTRVSPPAGTVPFQSGIRFAFGNMTSAAPTVTDAAGAASATFAVTAAGDNVAQAIFDGSGCLAPSISPPTSVYVYEAVQLTLADGLSGTCGVPLAIAATLATVQTGTGVGGQTLTFDLAGAAPAQLGVTATNGVASIGVMFASAGAYTVTAAFFSPDGWFTDRYGDLPPLPETDTGAILVGPATALFSQFGLSSGQALVGQTLNVSAVLVRASDGGPVVGAIVIVSVGSVIVATTATDVNGALAVRFAVGQVGAWTVSAAFEGDACLNPAAATASFVAYQAVQLQLTPVDDAPVCGMPFAVAARLLAFPQATPIPGQTVQLSSTGTASPQTAATDETGAATFPALQYVDAGSVTLAAVFSDINWFTAASPLPWPGPAVDTISMYVRMQTATLSVPVVTGPLYVGGPVAVSSTLSADGGTPVVGSTVGFVLNGQTIGSAMTDAAGDATITLTLPAGPVTIVAVFAGNGCQVAATSPPLVLTPVQRVALTLQAGPALCGAPVLVRAAISCIPTGLSSLANVTVRIAVANYSCAAVTDLLGHCNCTVPPFSSAVGTVIASATVLSTATMAGAQATTTLTIGRQSPLLTYTGRTVLPNGRAVVFQSVLTAGGAPVVGRLVTMTFGAGTSAQWCSAATDANGTAACAPANDWIRATFPGLFNAWTNRGLVCNNVLAALNNLGRPIFTDAVQAYFGCRGVLVNVTQGLLWQTLGTSQFITTSFAGDACYNPATLTTSTVVFSFLARPPGPWPPPCGSAQDPDQNDVWDDYDGGLFVVGDRALSPYYFYGPQWFARNPMSGNSTALPQFWGWSADVRNAIGQPVQDPQCGGYFNSPGQPTPWLELRQFIPSYFAVAVTSSTSYNPATVPGTSAGVHNDCASSPCRYESPPCIPSALIL